MLIRKATGKTVNDVIYIHKYAGSTAKLLIAYYVPCKKNCKAYKRTTRHIHSLLTNDNQILDAKYLEFKAEENDIFKSFLSL